LCPHSCSDHGACIQPPSLYAGRCICKQGWRGDDCAAPVCPDDCNGRGGCSRSGECECDDGWSGLACELPVCPGGYEPKRASARAHASGRAHVAAVNATAAANATANATAFAAASAAVASAAMLRACGVHGHCVLPSRVCVCDQGWSGPDCRQLACPHHNCNGHGVCGAREPGVCECAPFYFGEACESLGKCASGCRGHGNCTAGGRCECREGWTGADCEHRTCGRGDEGACAGRGRCIDGQCECDASRGESVCRAADRCMHGCNGHGFCNAWGNCSCAAGWEGDWCQWRNCTQDCGPHGVCDDGVCTCDAGWRGITCSLRPCLGADGECGGRGDCVQPSLPLTSGDSPLAACRCHKGWQGPDCSVPQVPP